MTFWLVWAALRIWTTIPWNVRMGKASTVKFTVLVCLHPANVGLGDERIYLHFAKIVGDDEKRRGAETGGHRLADVHVAGNDDAVNGRIN